MSVQQLKLDDPSAEPDHDWSDLYDLIAGAFDVPRERLTPDTSFAEHLGADSLDVLDLIMALEERCEVTLPDEAPGQIKTVRDLMQLFEPSGAQSARQPPQQP